MKFGQNGPVKTVTQKRQPQVQNSANTLIFDCCEAAVFRLVALGTLKVIFRKVILPKHVFGCDASRRIVVATAVVVATAIVVAVAHSHKCRRRTYVTQPTESKSTGCITTRGVLTATNLEPMNYLGGRVPVDSWFRKGSLGPVLVGSVFLAAVPLHRLNS